MEAFVLTETDVVELEMVQRRATKLTKGISYEGRIN